MHDYQKAKQNSYLLMVKVSKLHPEIMGLSPTFRAGILRLEALTIQIQDRDAEQSTNITGVTKDKNSLMSVLIHSLLSMAGAVYSYAVSQNDEALRARVNFKKWDVDHMSQTDLKKAASIVLIEAQKIAPEVLAGEGITASELSGFNTSFTKFNTASYLPRKTMIERSACTQQLIELFAEASSLKKNTLDRLAIQFKRKSPEFYLKYKSASKVIYRRKHKAKDGEEEGAVSPDIQP